MPHQESGRASFLCDLPLLLVDLTSLSCVADSPDRSSAFLIQPPFRGSADIHVIHVKPNLEHSAPRIKGSSSISPASEFTISALPPVPAKNLRSTSSARFPRSKIIPITSCRGSPVRHHQRSHHEKSAKNLSERVHKALVEQEASVLSRR